MSAAVVDLALHRQVRDLSRQVEEQSRQLDQFRFESDEWLAEQTTNTRIVEIRERYGTLLNHLQPVLLELFVLHMSIFAKPGDSPTVSAINMAAAAAGTLGRTDLSAALPALVADWRAKQPDEYRRLCAVYGATLFQRPDDSTP